MSRPSATGRLTQLATAPRAHANGVYPLQAAAELLISHRVWLLRADFRDRFIHHSAPTPDGPATMAEIDWPAAITALDHGDLPGSDSEQQMLRLAASIADGLPADLRDALTSLDHRNINRVITAVLHTSGLPCPSSQAAAVHRIAASLDADQPAAPGDVPAAADIAPATTAATAVNRT
jgi:hypothetical protein